MISFILIFMLSTITTEPANGFQIIEKPAQSSQLNHNYVDDPKKNAIIHNYNLWEDNVESKDKGYNLEQKHFLGSAESAENDSRRLFEWLSRLFQSTTTSFTQTTAKSIESNYERELKDRIFLKALHRNLTDVLFKLSAVEKQVAMAMEKKEEYAILTKVKPQVRGLGHGYYYHERIKRDVSNGIKYNTSEKNLGSEKSVNNTKKSTDTVGNVNTTECPCDNITVASGRRAGFILATPTEVKTKLILYLQESFQEIKSKIMSLKNLKQAFSDNVTFKIGYILANIDTLEVSMLNLKNNMDKNKELWEDNKILELYDTLRVSNQAVSGLIESLKVYLGKLSYQAHPNPEANFG